MVTHSAGLLVYRHSVAGAVQVLLAHPGGPFWARRDDGSWGVPKGELAPSEQALPAAYREFAEELGVPAPTGPVVPLGQVRLSGGKVVSAWAVLGDVELGAFQPGLFTMEWPPRSGRRAPFPEVDRIAWFDLGQARTKIMPSQLPFLDALLTVLT